jgi:hypothetical protein
MEEIKMEGLLKKILEENKKANKEIGNLVNIQGKMASDIKVLTKDLRVIKEYLRKVDTDIVKE